MTTQTDAAREHARRENGQFGEQQMVDPGSTVLGTPDPEVGRLVDRYGYGPERIQELIGQRGNAALAEAWLIMNGELTQADDRCSDIRDQIDQMKQALSTESAHAACALILREYPQVSRIVLSNTPDTYPGWTVRAITRDGRDIDLYDEDADDPVGFDVDTYLNDVDPEDKMTLSELCVGHRHGLLQCDGLQLHDDLTVDSVELDLARFHRPPAASRKAPR